MNFARALMLMSAAALALVATPAAQEPSVIHACVKLAQGQIRVVAAGEACRPSETPVLWNRTGPAGPAGPAGPPGAGSAGLVLVDATGQKVGSVMSAFPSTITIDMRAADDTAVVFFLTPDGFQQTQPAYRFQAFDEANCVGTPAWLINGPTPEGLTFGIPSTNQPGYPSGPALYYPAPMAIRSITLRSQRILGQANPTCQNVSPEQRYVSDQLMRIDTAQFQMPFRIVRQ